MPSKIHNIIGYLPSRNDAIYAIQKDSPGYIIAYNFGLNGEIWSPIPTAQYMAASAEPDFVAYLSVPFIPRADFTEVDVDKYRGEPPPPYVN